MGAKSVRFNLPAMVYPGSKTDSDPIDLFSKAWHQVLVNSVLTTRASEMFWNLMKNVVLTTHNFCFLYHIFFRARRPLSLISILTHVDLVTRRVFFMVSEVQIIVFQLFMEDTVVGVKSTTYSGLITSGFFRTNNNNNKRIF